MRMRFIYAKTRKGWKTHDIRLMLRIDHPQTRRVMRRKDYGIGNRQQPLPTGVLDAPDPEKLAVAELVPVLYAFKTGGAGRSHDAGPTQLQNTAVDALLSFIEREHVRRRYH